MLVRKVIASLNRRSSASGGLWTTTLSFNTTTSLRTATTENNTEEPKKPVRKLKQWRKMPEPELTFLQSVEPDKTEVKPLKFLRKPFKLTSSDIRTWLKSQITHYKRREQRFQVENHKTLGCDLAAARFLVLRGGKVKFYGQSEWTKSKEDGTYDLPKKYDPIWQITHLDASKIPLYYEGLDNFRNLKRVTWASFRGNILFDEWSMNKICAEFPNLEYLDVSECRNLNERAMEALYRAYNLKKLIITDWHQLPSFELTCVMLEDCNPDLTIEILEPPPEKSEDEED